MSNWKRIAWIAGISVVVLGVGAFGYFEAMKRAWIRINEYDIRSEGALKVGDLVPDLELATADGGEPRRLSELYAEHPLVLIFGSYT